MDAVVEGRGQAAPVEEGRWFAVVGALLPNIDEASPGLPGRPRCVGCKFGKGPVPSKVRGVPRRDAPYGAWCFLTDFDHTMSNVQAATS